MRGKRSRNCGKAGSTRRSTALSYSGVGTYVTRSLDVWIADLLAKLPALLLVGPRATGKTTSAARHARTVVRLDRAAEAAAFQADADVALAGLAEPVLLDEWQMVPGVLGAVKRAVDAEPRAGRFLVTGSVRNDLQSATWPGTGRTTRLAMYGMTVREQLGRGGEGLPFLDRIGRGEEIGLPSEVENLRGYVEWALRGGFPQAALLDSEPARRRWLESYVEQLLTRDVEAIGAVRDPRRLARYFEALVVHSAHVPDEKTLLEAAGVDRKTARAYGSLLENLLVVESIPAWTSNRVKRLVRAPKRYVTDPSFYAATLRVDVAAVLRDGDLLGRVLDTFVVSQLRAELSLCVSGPRLYHVRVEQGRHEIDLIAELAGQRLVAFEIKAASAPTRDDARHLAWLRDAVPDRFLAGIVLHTGPRSFQLEDRIMAMPICALWS